ncbi:MAG TPA: HAD family hydrolase [Bacillota bacterium]|nr:HAD family hydrolase [Bacillota bacterium]
MKYQTILFDLDGTLTDPAIGITNSIMYALKYYHITVNDRSELYRFIGPPLLPAFMHFYGFSEEKAERAVMLYREYFSEKGLFENTVYDGIPELLAELQKEGKALLVATSKPIPYTERILQHFHLDRYFSFIAGSNLDNSRTAKAEVIQFALENSKNVDPARTLMVGDREQDIIGAKQNQIAAAGVLYGYGSKEELERVQADFILDSVGQLRDFLLEKPFLIE